MSEKTRAGLNHAFEGFITLDDMGIFSLMHDLVASRGYLVMYHLIHIMTNRTIEHTPMGGLQPYTFPDFMATFNHGGPNAARLDSWPGQFDMPRVDNSLRLPDGGAELVVCSGQIVDVLPGMSLRTETGGTIETFTHGTISQCYGACGQKGTEYRRTMHADSATGLGLDAEGLYFEFSEVVFHDAMRVRFTGDSDYVLKLPAKKAWVAEDRSVGRFEDFRHVPWVGKGGDLEGEDRECGEVGPERRSDGRLEGRSTENVREKTSILQFRRWDMKADGPLLPCLGPRPINTVADFAKLLFELHDKHTGGAI